MKSLPPLNWLRAFEAAGRHSSFTRAADELCVSHSAISQQIRKLEEWCGVQLFRRIGSGVQVTDRGATLFRELNQDFERLSDIFDAMRLKPATGQLRIAAIPSVATRLLIPKIHEFKKTHPGISLNISYAAADKAVDLSELEVLITHYDGSYTGVYSTTHLLSGEVKPVCSPAYLKSASEENGHLDFSRATLLHDEDRSGWSRWLQRAGISTNSSESEIIFADFNLLSIATIAGHGVALCPVSLIAQELERGDLILLSDIKENTDRNYLMFCHQRKNEAVEKFRAWMVQATIASD